MDIVQQIQAGKLRCVRTGEALALEGDKLVNGGGKQHHYGMVEGKIPVVLKSESAIQALLEQNTAMEAEYRTPSFYQWLRNNCYPRNDNSREFCTILEETIRQHPADALVLSIGGGPTRDGEHVTNLNIGPFPNVDIVGDAHDLPYGDNTVDAVYCNAVLEHVRNPALAVGEIQRVLKPGGKVLSVIPFMQAYHGYPDHYQNFTLTGHEYLYISNGLRVISCGAAVGPIVAVTTLNTRFCLEYLPRPLNVIIGRVVQAIGLLLRPLDRLLEHHAKRYVIASTTYVLAEKPLTP